MNVRPKKYLGQHFLTDLSVARRIAGALRADRCRTVLEVGCGTGVLTQFLLERDDIDLYGAEVDGESIEYLREHYPQFVPRLMEGDFLQMDLSAMFPGGVNVIGNFPCNILPRRFFSRYWPPATGCRKWSAWCSARWRCGLPGVPGGKDYGILSVFLQAFYDIEYLFTVGEGVFNPPPKVKSAVVRLVRNGVERLDCDEALFARVVKATFGQRRKTIRNSLHAAFGDLRGEEHDYFSLRPEVLSVKQFEELTRWVGERIAEKP